MQSYQITLILFVSNYSLKVSLVCWILEISQFYLSSSSQIFQKFEGSTNMSDRELLF